VRHVGEAMLSYDEIVAMARETTLSPLDLAGRVLFKGKVKPPKERNNLKRKMSVMAIKGSDLISGLAPARRTSLSFGLVAAGTRRMSSGLPKRERSTSCLFSGDEAEKDIDSVEQFDSRMRQRNSSMQRRQTTNLMQSTDAYYANCLAIRSQPVDLFLGSAPSRWEFTMTSMDENRLLRELDVTKADRDHIEGLQATSLTGRPGRSEAQVALLALLRLSTDPPAAVGRMQRRTAQKMLRMYPLGLRFSGKNMSPLPCWLAGSQSVALNMSNNDLPVQLHFALFNGSNGFVLKPPAMVSAVVSPRETAEFEPWSTQRSQSGSEYRARVGLDSFRQRSGSDSYRQRAGSETPTPSFRSRSGSDLSSPNPRQMKRVSVCSPRRFRGTSDTDIQSPTLRATHESELPSLTSLEGEPNRDDYWPPPREMICRTTINLLSLHNCPKRGERRPRFDGSRGACHKYVARELSGASVSPDNLDPSSPSITLSLLPIGGFSAISRTQIWVTSPAQPPPLATETRATTRTVKGDGMNATLGEQFHCLTVEPYATFLRVGVTDRGQEVAYETALLGRLREGYRVFQMRGLLGTRIEICYLFARISRASEVNVWQTPRQLRLTSNQQREEISFLMQELSQRCEPRYTEMSEPQMQDDEPRGISLLGTTLSTAEQTQSNRFAEGRKYSP